MLTTTSTAEGEMSEAMVVSIQATRASGVIVQVERPAFLWVLERQLRRLPMLVVML